MNSLALMPATQDFFQKGKVTLQEIVSKFGKGYLVVCSRFNGEYSAPIFVATKDLKPFKLHTAVVAHHAENLRSLGELTVFAVTTYNYSPDGLSLNVLGDLELDLKAPLYAMR